MRRRFIALALILTTGTVWSTAPGPVAAGEAVRIVVAPRISRAPAYVRVQAIVEPSAANRTLQLVIDSGSYFRSSSIELEGESAPRVHTVEFKSVPAGTHAVRVAVVDGRGRVLAAVHESIQILE